MDPKLWIGGVETFTIKACEKLAMLISYLIILIFFSSREYYSSSPEVLFIIVFLFYFCCYIMAVLAVTLVKLASDSQLIPIYLPIAGILKSGPLLQSLALTLIRHT